MKKLVSLLLVFSLLLCSVNGAIAEDTTRDFTSLSDPVLLQYIEDNLYAELVDQFDSEDYIIENISAIYISQEYLEELAYNSNSNIFFGYTLAELDAQFQGKRYVFTLGDSGETVVEEFVSYDNIYERIIQNVAIGTGVILVCATVTVVTAATGLTTVSGYFAISTKEATAEALQGAGFGGIFAGIIEGISTGDFDSNLKASALAASEGFKWGAISGAVLPHVPKPRAVTGGVAVADDVLNLTDDALKLSDDALNLSDDALRISDDAVNAIDDILKNADYTPPNSIKIADDWPEWKKAEFRALNEKGGYEQITFQNGEIVPYATSGGTRPDVVRKIGDHLEAVEVKYYDLSNKDSVKGMYKILRKEIIDRIEHLPNGSTQRIVLDVTDRGYDAGFVNSVIDHIRELLDDVYPNIPIDIVGLIV